MIAHYLATLTLLAVLCAHHAGGSTSLQKLDYPPVGSAETRSFTIDLNTGQFLKDGLPYRFMAGDIHYFRIHSSEWLDRLERVRAMGLNAVQVYVSWTFHEKEPGIFDFASEEANLPRFLTLAQESNLDVLLRLGPYVNAELENGGLPSWHAKMEKGSLRTSHAGYLYEVKRYFDALLPLLKPLLYRNGGPVIMLQIENEYGSIRICDKTYLRWLRDLVRQHLGNETVLYTTDGSDANLVECGRVEGVYPTVDFGALDKKEDVEAAFAIQRNASGSSGPLVNSEFYTMWFQQWGQRTPVHQEVETVVKNLKWMWELGASFSLYMVHGGSNFGFAAGSEADGPVLTSYDYSAPISEAGQITPLYLGIRDWIAQLPDWPNPPSRVVPANHTGIAMRGVEVELVGSLISVANRTVNQRYCRTSEQPLTFEQLDRTYTFVWYQTLLPTLEGGSKIVGNLSVTGLHDYGHVYLDEEYQGNISVCGQTHIPCKSWLMLHNAKAGQKLNIIVESHGRQTYPTKLDPKGVLSTVTLDGHPLLRWLHCGLEFNLLRYTALKIHRENEGAQANAVGEQSAWGQNWLNHHHHHHHKTASYEGEEAENNRVGQQEPIFSPAPPSGPAVYATSFATHLTWDGFHTFFDSRPWTKGVLLINGFNLGRFWPELGPQMTLYVPGGVFHSDGGESEENDIIVLELGGGPITQRRTLDFVAQPVFEYRRGGRSIGGGGEEIDDYGSQTVNSYSGYSRRVSKRLPPKL